MEQLQKVDQTLPEKAQDAQGGRALEPGLHAGVNTGPVDGTENTIAHDTQTKEEIEPNNANISRKSARVKAKKEEERRLWFGTVISGLFCLSLMLLSFLVGVVLKLEEVPMVQAVPAMPTLSLQERPTEEAGYSASEVVALVTPSVVSIIAYSEDSVMQGSSGSGVILTADGYIATNAKAIVGLELAVTRIDAKRKLSQNRLAVDFEGALEGLAAGSDRERAVAAEMRLEAPRDRGTAA